jgi:hypothetical protein
MRATPLTQEHVQKARDEDLYIVQIMVSGQYRKSKDGGVAITGAFTEEKARELRDFIREWYKGVE